MKACGLKGLRAGTPDATLFRAARSETADASHRNIRPFALLVCLLSAVAILFPNSAHAQSTPSFAAPAAYNMQPGTAPVGVVTGVFNNSGGLLDFAVLEQVPNSASYQIEIFHGKSDGTFCTNCGNATPNPDVVALAAGVEGYAVVAGQFRSGGPLDIAVGTSTGIVFLQNNGTGTFALDTNPSDTILKTNGYAVLTVGQFNGANTSGTQDIAAVTPTVSGSVNFTVFFSNGDGTFTAPATYSVNSTWNQCTAIMPGNFQSQTKGSDLALLCSNPSYAGILVYLNSGSGGGYTYTFGSTPYTVAKSGVTLPSTVVGTLNGLATIFVSAPSNSFVTYQSNGLAGQNNAFTSVFMVPVGLAPHNPLAILYNSSAAVDFVSGPSVSTFTSYSQSGTSVNGTWNSTPSLGPTAQAFATGYSPNLTQGAAYVIVNAGVHSGSYSTYQTYVDERSVSVFLVTLNADGTVATTTNTPPVYASNAGSFPPSFATGDFNGDGVMDLAVGGADNSTGDANATIYLANSNGSLPPPASTPSSVVTVNNTFYSGTDAIVAGKFRSSTQTGGKTLYDLAIFSFGQISIQASNGDGTFTAGNSYSLSSDPNYPGFDYRSGSGVPPFAPVLTAVDVNGDGIADLVLTLPEDPFNCRGSGSASHGAIYVLISNADGTFQNPVFITPPVVNPVSVTAAKFFGGSVSDLVFADGGELCSGNTATTIGTAVGILQNQVPLDATSITASEFTPSVILPQSSDQGVPNVTAVASADMDGNGSPDLIVSNIDGIQILLNQGGGSFAPTGQGIVPLYAGDVVPGPLCSTYVGCVSYNSQIATGSFFASGENDVAASVGGVVYLFQNQSNSGTLAPPTQGFVAGPDSTIIGALAGAGGLNNLLVATSQGTAYLANSAAVGPAIATFIPYTYATSIDFGSVYDGQTSPLKILELYNSGTGPLQLDLISLIDTSSQTIQSAPFVLNSIYCNTSPGAPVSTSEPVTWLTALTLQPGIACDFALTMQPTTAGSYTGTFNFLDNAGQTNAPNQQPNGQNFVQTIQLTGTALPAFPFASFSPASLNFNNVNVGTTVTQSTTVTNTGIGALTLNLAFTNILGTNTYGFYNDGNSLVCNGFAAQFPITLLTGQYCTISVPFDPPGVGNWLASLYFLDNALPGDSNLTSTLSGSEYVQALPLSGTGLPSSDLSIGTGSNGKTSTGFAFGSSVGNLGPNGATNVTVKYSFSFPVQFVSLTVGGSSPGCSLPAAGSTVSTFSCDFGSLAANASISPVVTFTSTSNGELTLTTTVSADQFDPSLSNNTSGASAAYIANTTGTAAASVPLFQAAGGSPLRVGSGPSTIATGDFNHDGIPDLAVANANDNTVSILLGSGGGTFRPAVNYTVNLNNNTLCITTCTSVPLSVAVGDFNGDGNLDLAVTNIPINTGCSISSVISGGGTCASVAILLGNGDGTFQPANQVGLSGQVPTSVTVADFNKDGKQDLAVTDLNSNEVEILLGDGKGGFSEKWKQGVGSQPVWLVTGDYNKDGALDLAVANAGDGTITVIFGLGDGTFTPSGTYSSGGNRPVFIAQADFLNSGHPALAVANLASSTVCVLIGNFDGTFGTPGVAPTCYGVGGDPSSIAIADYDQNGQLDLAVADRRSNSVAILFNTGDAFFSTARNAPVGLNPQSLVTADFNGDGLPDLAVVNSGSGTVSILLNAQQVLQQAPGPQGPPTIGVGYSFDSIVNDPTPTTQQYVATMSISNQGAAANSIQVVGATLNGVNSTSIPITLSLGPISSSNITLNFPESAGAAGAHVVLTVKGTYSTFKAGSGTVNGTWTGSYRLTLPPSTQ